MYSLGMFYQYERLVGILRMRNTNYGGIKMKCKLLCKLKGLLGIYTPGCEYWVDLKDIDIPINFLRHHPRHEKMEQKWAYYRQTGEFESPILLNRDFELVDGYTSYIIAKTENLHKVLVYFVD